MIRSIKFVLFMCFMTYLGCVGMGGTVFLASEGGTKNVIIAIILTLPAIMILPHFDKFIKWFDLP